MIYTLTTNPAIDMNIHTVAGELKPNSVNRVAGAEYSPNGKGLNVSFTLEHYGTSSCVLGFFAGFTGTYIVEGARQICPVIPVEVEGITRVTVLLRAGEVEYTMPGAGAFVPQEKQEEMFEILRTAEDMDCLVVSGSLAPGIESTFYDQVIECMQGRGVPFIFDVSSSYLERIVAAHPLLIKPNDDELRDIFGLDVSDDASAAHAMQQLSKLGAQNALLTMGSKGAYFGDGEHLWRANAADIKPYQTACAGDATLASFLSVWFKDRSAVEPALVRAMATGGNVAMCAGLGDFALVNQLATQIHVEQLA